MSDVFHQVRDAVEEYELLERGDRLVVGLSGGPDSLCLLHVLTRLRKPYGMHLHVAHLDHGARGEASQADAEFVRRTAAEWDLPVTVGERDVPGLAEEHGLAFEEAARRARYAFLAQVARRIGARNIAVGHNADDQAETVLMHVIRGSGLAGLRGMLPRTPITDYRLLTPFRGDDGGDDNSTEHREGRRDNLGETSSTPCIIRPLLAVRRPHIERYCANHNLEPRFDRSNLDTTYFRNRLRHELMPQLETYNPRIRERLCHMADVAAADFEVLVNLRQEAWDQVVCEEREDAIVFDQATWQALPVSLQRATLRHATYRLRESLRDVTFVHVENARKVALEGETGKASTLPMGLALTVGYQTLTIGAAGQAGPPPDEPLLWTETSLPVPVPGSTPLPETNWMLETEILEQWSMAKVTARDHPWTAFFDAQAFAEPLRLRSRQESDTFQPLGMQGHHVQISDLMINVKIPEAWRDHVPLLVAADEILWVCGRRVAESAKVEPSTERVARFRFEKAI
ncbi:MAG: tRNA lysidine(34) synthetase TilS [Anaerolineae bacterium]